MAFDWIMLLPSVVFTRIKTEFSSTIKSRFKMDDRNFSTTNSSDTPSVFPFVYVNLLPAVEEGQDLYGKYINAGLFTFQVDVYDNQMQDNARAVMTEVIRIMKNMRFEIIAMPEFETTGNTHRCTARFRRLIGANEYNRL